MPSTNRVFVSCSSALHISPVMNVLPSTVVFEGDVLEVVCKVVHPPVSPPVEVFLNKDKRVLKKASVSLVHRYEVQSGDSGEFVCKAEWGSTQKETHQFVRVKGEYRTTCVSFPLEKSANYSLITVIVTRQ